MNEENLIGILELSTQEIKCVIAKLESNDYTILGFSSKPSQGFHSGVIVNLSEATKTVRSCISEAEKNSKIFLKKIFVIIELNEFICTRVSKYKKIGGGKIEKDDISYSIKEAKNQIKQNNRQQSIIHIFNYNYFIDGKEFQNVPIDIFADQFRHEISIITSPNNILKNINQTLINCDIEIAKFISKSFALGVQSLDFNDLKFGSTIIDFGFEKTSMVIFKNSALVYSYSIPIGVNHITKDLSRVCSLSLEESEYIRNHFDLKTEVEVNDVKSKKDNLLDESFFKTSTYRKISIGLIEDVINSRYEEIFKLLKKEIYFLGFTNTAGRNIYITQDNPTLLKLKDLTSKYFSAMLRK